MSDTEEAVSFAAADADAGADAVAPEGAGNGDDQGIPAIYAEMTAQSEAERAAAHEARISKMPARVVEKPAEPDVTVAKAFGKQFYSFGGATREATGDKKASADKEDNWTIGFDVTDPEMEKRRLARAARFGAALGSAEAPADGAADAAASDDTEEKGAAAAALEDTRLPKKCNVDPTQPTDETRPEALHVYGTDSMSTKDIINIFAAYVPSHLEWINDSSCNVVWPDGDNFSVKRVLWALGKPIAEGALMPSTKTAEKKVALEDSFAKYMEQRDKPKQAAAAATAGAAEEKEDADADGDADEAAAAETPAASAEEPETPTKREPTAEETEALKLWSRMVVKKRVLMIRQATIADVKQRGAARKSQYYQTHGGRGGRGAGGSGRRGRGRGGQGGRGSGVVVMQRKNPGTLDKWGHDGRQPKRAYKDLGPHRIEGGPAIPPGGFMSKSARARLMGKANGTWKEEDDSNAASAAPAADDGASAASEDAPRKRQKRRPSEETMQADQFEFDSDDDYN